MARFALALHCSFLFVTLSTALVVIPEVSASPEPAMVDPMSMQLFIVSAGATPRSAKVLGETASVCPSDYPKGFSVECKAPYEAVTFYVDGEGVRKEMTKPFYIAGDANGIVRSWVIASGSERVTVSCKYGGERVMSKISFAC